VDLRIKFSQGPADILELLVSETRSRGYTLFESFISRSAKIEALQTNPEARVHSILHGAPNSVAHQQMGCLANEVLTILDLSQDAKEEKRDAASEPIPLSTSDLLVSDSPSSRSAPTHAPPISPARPASQVEDRHRRESAG
jgi:hypothetical protein